ncbi:hypothetical protein [Acinetobacter pittii]|uniref:hypothetical protein n=1 Tax=Acinetobacter pittii TaxID=48296 RepID=UPI0007089DBE|nr:hypothetical protein [Acinetobacter pittii]KRI32408.1 hypothetical protein APB87_09605 [Acinetobacter pittii]
MAVPEQTPYKEYTANGITTVFPLDFDVLEQDHLIVLINDLEPAVGSWHLDAANDAVVFTNAPVSGAIIKIRRDTPLSRTTNYQLYDRSFLPDPVNKDFDALWRKLQEMGVINWMIDNNIKDLNEYVNSLNDETKAIFLKMIHDQGTSLEQLDAYVDSLYKKLANTAVEKGWLAEFIADGSENQAQINKKTVRQVESIADLLLIQNPVDGQTLYAKSYYAGENKGGDNFYFDSTRVNENDGITIFSGWVRDLSDKILTIDDAGLKEDGSNATIVLQKLADALQDNFEFIIAGKHLVNKRIKIEGKSNLRVTGSGTISAKELRDTWTFEDHYGVLYFVNCPYLTVSKNVKIVGAKKFWKTHSDPTQAGDSPISLKNCPHSLIEHTDLSHAVAWGIVAENSPYTIAQFNKIDDIVRQSGINIVIGGGKYCKTISNTITNVGLYGIEWETYDASPGNKSYDNIIEDCFKGIAVAGTSQIELDSSSEHINYCYNGAECFPLLNAVRVNINASGVGCYIALSGSNTKNVTYEGCNFDYSKNKAWLHTNASNFIVKFGATRSEIFTLPDSTITAASTVYINDVAYTVNSVELVNDSYFGSSLPQLKKITLASNLPNDTEDYVFIKKPVSANNAEGLKATLTNSYLLFKKNTLRSYGRGISHITNYFDDGVGREYYVENNFIDCDNWIYHPVSVAKGSCLKQNTIMGANSISVNVWSTLTQLQGNIIEINNSIPKTNTTIPQIPFNVFENTFRFRLVISLTNCTTTGNLVIRVDGVDSYIVTQAEFSAASKKVFTAYGVGSLSKGPHSISLTDTVGDLAYSSYQIQLHTT